MFSRLWWCGAFVAGLAFTSTVSSAQDASALKIEPDRDDFTRGTGVVPRGHIQIESGSTGTRGGDDHEFLLGDTQIRVPLSNRAEVRLNIPPYRIERDSTRSTGIDDSGIEARLVLSKSAKVATAITVFSTLPTGARRVAEHSFQPGAVFAADFSLSPRANLVFNLGGERPTRNHQRFSRYIASTELQFEASQHVTLFSEIYALGRDEPDGPSQKFADVGADYFVDNRTAFDARVGVGIGNHVGGPNYFYSLGVSHLF